MPGLAALGHHFADVELGLLLQVPVDGGLDDDVLLDVPDIALDETFDPVRDVGFRSLYGGGDGGLGIDRGGLGFLGRDVALVRHGLEHGMLPGRHQRRVALGVEARGRLERASQRCRFAQRQIAGRVAEIELRGGLDADLLVAEIDAV